MARSVLLLHALPRLLGRVVLCDFFDGIIELVSSLMQGVHRRQVALPIETILRSLEEVYLFGLAYLNAHCFHLWLTVSLEAGQRTLAELPCRIFGDKGPFFLGVSAVGKGIIALSILIIVEILSFPDYFNLVLLVQLLREVYSEFVDQRHILL